MGELQELSGFSRYTKDSSTSSAVNSILSNQERTLFIHDPKALHHIFVKVIDCYQLLERQEYSISCHQDQHIYEETTAFIA